MDGETVAIGGMIQTRDQKNENKIPWLGDLPGVGALFRFRTQVKSKQELMVILTPHIVRNRAEADRMLALESRRMDWVINDVVKIHGTTGFEPILPEYLDDRHGPAPLFPAANPEAQPAEPLPAPKTLPPGPMKPGPAKPASAQPAAPVSSPAAAMLPPSAVPAPPVPLALGGEQESEQRKPSVPEKKEGHGWHLFGK
jgi:hypothetical protein